MNCLNSQSLTFGVRTLSPGAINKEIILGNSRREIFFFQPIKFFTLRPHTMDSSQLFDAVRDFASKYVALNNDELELISQAMVVREFCKKGQVTKAGETEAYLNFVAKGLARKFFRCGKEEKITHIAKEGEFITCYESYIKGRPSAYEIETIEPSILISISKQKMEDLYLQVPKVERLGRLVLTEQFIYNEHWEYDRVRLNSQERFINFIRDNSELFQRVPQKFLASYLNIQPETFSRMKHLLKTTK
jgi:CRP-like cAMP-binding protein